MSRSAFNGLLVIDKPGGMTSRAAVDQAQHWFDRHTRVGHTGTLDPLATGILVLTVGSATRLAEYVQQLVKTYRTTIQLGARSDSDDADGRVTPVAVACPPERQQVDAVLSGFVGTIEQVPPAYSAAKVAGRRAYALARRGQEVVLGPRRIHVERIDLLRYDYPQLELEVRCGKGTYIRSLARDMGERLGCGGYIATLRRTHVGPFTVADALALDADATTAAARLLPLLAAVASLQRVRLSADALARLRQGQAVACESVGRSPALQPEEQVAIVDESANLSAIGTVDESSRMLRPLKVF